MRRPIPRSKNHRSVCMTRSAQSTQSSEGGVSEDEPGPSVTGAYYGRRAVIHDGIGRYPSRLMVRNFYDQLKMYFLHCTECA